MLGAVHSGLGSLTSITNQDNVLIDIPIGQSDGVDSSTEVPSSPMSFVCVNMTKLNQHSSHLQ